jgi:glycosyltransferase involved in cell wall biosynthesis
MQYIPHLEKAGWHGMVWHNRPSYGDLLFAHGRSPLARLTLILRMCVALPGILMAGNFDIVFLQRRLPGFNWKPIFERLLRRTCGHLIFDFDDAIYLGSRAEAAFREIINFSDQVIAVSKYLANIAITPFKTTVIPTPVDTERFKPIVFEKFYKQNSAVIGWTGTSSNYQYLYPLASTLRRVVKCYPHTILKIICDKKPDPKILYGIDVKYVPWRAEIEVEQLQDIDPGIMYLSNDPWSMGKCGFNLIQYMSLGKPVVASPIGANIDIVKHGTNGYLAATTEDWNEYLIHLLSDPYLRFTMGREARKKIEKEFSVRGCFPKLEAVFQKALTL